MTNLKYFTTPIYYVNGEPHIGSAYTTLSADTFARYWQQKNGRDSVHFLTGTDENSQKTVEAASQAEKPVPEYLNDMSAVWKSTFEQMGVQFDDFIRTTEARHHKTVHEVIGKILENGDIYKGEYVGKYCVGCETFLKDSELTEEGFCPDHLKAPNELKEENYFFRLSKYQDRLLKFYEENPNWLRPAKRRNEVLSFIKSGLDDISISRESAELGIPMPNNVNHKIYIWFDALINYYTAVNTKDLQKFWPYAQHIIGKDITRFHCIVWPAMLMSANLPMPQEVFAHGFFTVNGHKMSKSLGNVIHPLDLSKQYGNDALRIGLLSAFEFGNDGDFSMDQFESLYNSKLAGGVGNLFNRVVVLIHKFLDGKKVRLPANNELVWKEKFATAMEEKKVKEAIDVFFQLVDSANELLNETEVWKLAKTDLEAAKKVFAILLQKLELIQELSVSILPETAEKMKLVLGEGDTLNKSVILFPRVEK
ncbi:methionine--tRNA ligase [bacterium DOLZORAL124_38_8]|nr:MAG: methionine--tRNA ligase [bacterium DOLZORAL124_38_8]